MAAWCERARSSGDPRGTHRAPFGPRSEKTGHEDGAGPMIAGRGEPWLPPASRTGALDAPLDGPSTTVHVPPLSTSRAETTPNPNDGWNEGNNTSVHLSTKPGELHQRWWDSPEQPLHVPIPAECHRRMPRDGYPSRRSLARRWYSRASREQFCSANYFWNYCFAPREIPQRFSRGHQGAPCSIRPTRQANALSTHKKGSRR